MCAVVYVCIMNVCSKVGASYGLLVASYGLVVPVCLKTLQ